MPEPGTQSLWQLAGPRYWPAWLLWLAMLGASKLPPRARFAVGRGFGRLLRLAKRREQRTAARNLELCFPQLAAPERADLLDRHFAAVGMSFVEMAMAWTWPIERLLAAVRIEGREHIERAAASGNGVLLFTAHFTTIEIGAAVLEAIAPRTCCMYRPQRNALLDALMVRGRARFAEEQIPTDDIRRLVRKLREGHVVVYLPDQTSLGNQSALVPFFGEPALTNIATSKIARLCGAAILPYFVRRLPGDAGYVVDIGAPLPGVPGDDPVADARALFATLEDWIRKAPEQYLWLYKKFKNRPAPYGNPYA